MAPIPALTTSVGCFQCSLVFFINIMIRYFDFHGLRVLLGLSALIVALLAGCTGKSETSKKNQEETTPSAETKSPKSKSPKSKITQRKLTPKKSTKIVSKAFSSSDKKNSFSTSRGFSSGSRKEVQLGRAFWEFALESQSNGATLVVWLIDRSSSAEKLMQKLIAEVNDFELVENDKMFESVIATFSTGPVKFPLESPLRDSAKIREAFNNLSAEKEDGEQTFAALNQCLEKYGPIRRKDRKNVIMVLVTDEAGEDAETVGDGGDSMSDQTVALLKKYGVSCFVIVSPAPFGRSIEASKITTGNLDYGPETLFPERIQLGMWDGSTVFNRFDSGFGPWHLERICRSSGGRFLADRPSRSGRIFNAMQSNWPYSISRQFDDSAMSAYKPNYQNRARYLDELSTNKAKNALHLAAQLPYADVFRTRSYEFAMGNEAQLVREVNSAQRMPAVIRPGLEKLYNLLRAGEGDREQMESKRWQASFDLAYGRVLANYVRVVGLNSMLAELKGGKSFQDPASTRWMLEPAAEVQTGSSNRKMAEKAQIYLTRVVEDHPNTPWAEIAKMELDNPLGWGWKETQR